MNLQNEGSDGTYPLGAGSRAGHDPERDEPAVQQLLRHPDPRPTTAPTGAGFRPWTWSRAESEFVLRADLPGLSEKDVNIEVEDNVLTISGERKAEHEERKEGYYRVERSYGSFRRSLTLPEGVDARGGQGELRPRRARGAGPEARGSASRARSRSPSAAPSPRRSRARRRPSRPRSNRFRQRITRFGPRARGPSRLRPQDRRSAQDAGVAERVAAGLGPHAQAVGPLADRDGGAQTARWRC